MPVPPVIIQSCPASGMTRGDWPKVGTAGESKQSVPKAGDLTHGLLRTYAEDPTSGARRAILCQLIIWIKKLIPQKRVPAQRAPIAVRVFFCFGPAAVSVLETHWRVEARSPRSVRKAPR